MSCANFSAARVAQAAEARINEIVKHNERRDAQTERLEHLRALAIAGPVDGVVSLSLDDFALLAKHFPAGEASANV